MTSVQSTLYIPRAFSLFLPAIIQHRIASPSSLISYASSWKYLNMSITLVVRVAFYADTVVSSIKQ